MGFTVSMDQRQHNVVILRDYQVSAGPYAGKAIDIAVPANDFPYSAPAGIHITPQLVPNGQKNISQSAIGPAWQYWSRRLPEWSKDRTAKHIVSYINKVLLDA